jgi:c-di-GMP-binding flagellar brake protein YcgR
MATQSASGSGETSAFGRLYQQRRRHARVPVKGTTRLFADTSGGMVTLSGQVVDLSVSGCAIKVHAQLEPDYEARLELSLDGERVWVPGHIVWVRTREKGWMVGVRFDRLVPAKADLIHRLVAERQRRAER